MHVSFVPIKLDDLWCIDLRGVRSSNRRGKDSSLMGYDLAVCWLLIVGDEDSYRMRLPPSVYFVRVGGMYWLCVHMAGMRRLVLCSHGGKEPSC